MMSRKPDKPFRVKRIPALALVALLAVAGAPASSEEHTGPPTGETSEAAGKAEDPKAARTEGSGKTSGARGDADPEPAETAAAAVADRSSDDARDEAPLRFTNEDLPEAPLMYRGRSAADADGRAADRREDRSRRGRKPAKAAAPDADVEAAALQARRRMLEKRAVDLEERIAYLEARLFALKNPLHRGATPSRADEEDAVGGQSNVARVDWARRQLDAARKELQDTRAELQTLPRR